MFVKNYLRPGRMRGLETYLSAFSLRPNPSMIQGGTRDPAIHRTTISVY